jgi:hypothetical protein
VQANGTTTTNPYDQPLPLAQNPYPTEGPAGAITFEKGEHDFGRMFEGEIAKHTFDLLSAGENPLLIHNVKPTCGCTIGIVKVENDAGEFVAYDLGQPIAPGRKIKVEAELNTKNKTSVASSKINIYCNDPRAVVVLDLRASVDTFFASAPGNLDFGQMSTADEKTMKAILTAKNGARFKLRQQYPQVIPGVAIDLAPVEPDADGRSDRWELAVKLGPGLTESNLGYPVQLRSDQLVPGVAPMPDGSFPDYGLSVMIGAQVRGLISYTPQYLSFGLLKAGQSTERKFTLTSNDPEFTIDPEKLRMHLEGPNPSVPEFAYPDAFTMRALPAAEDGSVEILLTLEGMPEDANGSFSGRLVVETGHASRPTVSVLFSGVARASR